MPAPLSTTARRLQAKIDDRSALVGVVGLGYVGLPLALAFARAGFTVPAEEDHYALARAGAVVTHRAALAVLAPAARPLPEPRRHRGVRRARAAGLEVRESDDLEAYWALLSQVLEQRYATRPVHTLDEIRRLRGLFPLNIRLFATYGGPELLGGILVYESERVARLQYIAAGEAGRQSGALDLIVEHLVRTAYRDKRWIDFGTSEGGGRAGLNEGVMEFKESWGARTVLQLTYELPAGG